MEPTLVIRVLTAGAFLFYGVLCLFSPAMVLEFERYGMPRMRVLTAVLEILGALGLILGPTPQWVAAAAAGLCVLMVGALIVRLRIEDPWQAMLPAMVLLLVNGWIAVQSWRAGQS
ncbi:MAG: DoxX family protein [Planctomycetia bacterium]